MYNASSINRNRINMCEALKRKKYKYFKKKIDFKIIEMSQVAGDILIGCIACCRLVVGWIFSHKRGLVFRMPLET